MGLFQIRPQSYLEDVHGVHEAAWPVQVDQQLEEFDQEGEDDGRGEVEGQS